MGCKQMLLKLTAAGPVQNASRTRTGKWAEVSVVAISFGLKADHPQMLLVTCTQYCPAFANWQATWEAVSDPTLTSSGMYTNAHAKWQGTFLMDFISSAGL